MRKIAPVRTCSATQPEIVRLMICDDDAGCCPIGRWLNGKSIQASIDLPLPVIDAVFKIYES